MVEYLVKADCGHKVRTEVEFKLQYPDDEHYIFCPSCRDSMRFTTPHTCWQIVTSQTEIPNDMSHVYRRLPCLLPDEILRVQPSVPINRVRPFPYAQPKRTRGRGKRTR